MIPLFLHILHRVKAFDKKTSSQENYCQILRDRAKELLKTWVVQADVVGGSFFGGSVKNVTAELKKELQELKVHKPILIYNFHLFQFWESILTIEFPADEMKNDLEAIVLDLVTDRVSAIPTTQLKINVFISVESREGIPDSFRNIFLTKAIEALNAISKKAVSNSYYYCM